MDARRWQRARELFDRLVESPEDEWPGRLQAECDDPEVREEALAMLRADLHIEGATSIFERASAVASSLATGGTPAADADVGGPVAGERVGPFRLVREIGRGGMGAVWLAERDDGEFQQRVAVKLIRSDWDAAGMLARFRAERQIVANLQHPNIAHLVDGGVTADGKPWLALEYVEGTDIVRWCDARRLGLEARLHLFLDACAAVSHAHARLVVHRDLKPSNILVGADGQVKLLDFGIAKLLDTDAAETGATRTFTPGYAAPEQVRGDAVTTSVDVHALGLVLHELLSGGRAYRPERSTPAAYERALLDDEPQRPSASLAAGIEGDVAAARGMTRPALARALRGDLDAIVAKALRKEPAQRYDSVQSLAEDIGRYLQRRPVLARRGDWRYRARRFLRRHALAACFAAIALVALLGGLGASAWQARVARAERDTARAALGFMRELFDNADPAQRKGENLSVRDLLDTGVRTIREALQDQHAARDDLLLTMASAYLGLGQLEPAAPLIREVLQDAERRGDDARLAAALIQECRRLDLGNESDACPALLDRAEGLLDAGDPAQARLVAYSLALRIYGLQLANRYDRIVEDMRRGRALLGHAPEDRFLRVELASHEGFALNRLGRPAEAAALLTPLARELRHDDDAERVLLVDVLGTLSTSLGALERHDEAVSMQREAVAIAEALYGEDDPAISGQLNTLAATLSRAGRGEEAIEVMQRTVAIDRGAGAGGKNPDLASALCNLGVLYLRDRRYDDARVALDEAIGLARDAEFALELGRCQHMRAATHFASGRLDEADADVVASRAVLAPLHRAGDDPMLRSRLLGAALVLAREGTAGCVEAGALHAAYAARAQPDPADAAFAAALRQACAGGSAAPTAPMPAYYRDIVARIGALSARAPATAPASR